MRAQLEAAAEEHGWHDVTPYRQQVMILRRGRRQLVVDVQNDSFAETVRELRKR